VIGICTDSFAQLPPILADRFGIEVVPLTVTVDGREYLEGVGLDADDFYALHAGSRRRPTVEFGQPSPGQFALAYDELIGRGCTQILSIHTSASISATLRAARLAAHSAPVPIRLIDSRTARSGVSCVVWATAEAIAAGASSEEAAGVAASIAGSIDTVFTTDGLDLIRDDQGRDDHRGDDHNWDGLSWGGIRRHTGRATVSTLVDERSAVVAEVSNLAEAVNAMAAFTLRASCGSRAGLNVAVGSAHQALQPAAEALTAALTGSAHIRDVVPFRIGPSVGIASGPGTVGCIFYPVPPAGR
jgi:fatty acid-binding protein DegV